MPLKKEPLALKSQIQPLAWGPNEQISGLSGEVRLLELECSPFQLLVGASVAVLPHPCSCKVLIQLEKMMIAAFKLIAAIVITC